MGLLKTAMKLTTIFILATVLVWLFVRLLVFNPWWQAYPNLYWLAPTIGVVMLYLIFEKWHYKLTAFLKEAFLVALVSLTAIQALDVFFVYCEPDKNPPFAIKVIIAFINAVIFLLLLFRTRHYKRTTNVYFLALLIVVTIGVFVFYPYSPYRLYDSVYFWVTGSFINM